MLGSSHLERPTATHLLQQTAIKRLSSVARAHLLQYARFTRRYQDVFHNSGLTSVTQTR